MKKDYINNINSMLNDGSVENIPIKNIDILKSIFFSDDIGDSLYKNFKRNFNSTDHDIDDLYCKTEDLVYHIHLLVNEYLIPTHDLHDDDCIKEVVKDLINKGADFYDAVSYDDFDNEIIEEYDLLYGDIGVSI